MSASLTQSDRIFLHNIRRAHGLLVKIHNLQRDVREGSRAARFAETDMREYAKRIEIEIAPRHQWGMTTRPAGLSPRTEDASMAKMQYPACDPCKYDGAPDPTISAEYVFWGSPLKRGIWTGHRTWWKIPSRKK